VTAATDLRERFLWFVQGMLATVGATLVFGLVVHLSQIDAAMANRAFAAGFVVLMATPVVRTLIALAERLRRRDFLTVSITTIVLLELSLTLWYAAVHV
jgi:uncharacterized membrane protein